MEEERDRRMNICKANQYANMSETDNENSSICDDDGSVLKMGIAIARPRTKLKLLYCPEQNDVDLKDFKDLWLSNSLLPRKQKSLNDLRSLDFGRNRSILVQRPTTADSHPNKSYRVPMTKSLPTISHFPITLPRPRRSKSSPPAVHLTATIGSSEWNELLRSVTSAAQLLTLNIQESSVNVNRTFEALDIAKSEIKHRRLNTKKSAEDAIRDKNVSSSSNRLFPTPANIQIKPVETKPDVELELEDKEQKKQAQSYESLTSLEKLTAEMKNSFENFVIESTFDALHNFQNKISFLEEIENDDNDFEIVEESADEEVVEGSIFDSEEDERFQESAFEPRHEHDSPLVGVVQEFIPQAVISAQELKDMEKLKSETETIKDEESGLKYHGIPVLPATPEICQYVANAFEEVKCMKYVIEKELEDLKSRQRFLNLKSSALSIDSEGDNDSTFRPPPSLPPDDHGDDESDDPNLHFSTSRAEFIREIENELKEIDSCAGWISNNILSKMEAAILEGEKDNDIIDPQPNKIKDDESSVQNPEEIKQSSKRSRIPRWKRLLESEDNAKEEPINESRQSPREMDNFDMYYSPSFKPGDKVELDVISSSTSSDSSDIVNIFKMKSTPRDSNEDSGDENDPLNGVIPVKNSGVEFCEGVPIIPSATGIGREIRAWFDGTIGNRIAPNCNTGAEGDLSLEISGSNENAICKPIQSKSSLPLLSDVERTGAVNVNVSNSNLSISAASSKSFSTERSRSEVESDPDWNWAPSKCLEDGGTTGWITGWPKGEEELHPSVVRPSRLVRLRQWISRTIIQPCIRWFRRNSF